MIDTIIVFTTQMETLAQFYREGLAFSAEPQQFGGAHIGFQLENVYLGFDQVDGATPSDSTTLWFSVPDIQEAFDRLVRLGATVRYAPTKKPFGDILASLHDLDGNVFGIVERK